MEIPPHVVIRKPGGGLIEFRIAYPSHPKLDAVPFKASSVFGAGGNARYTVFSLTEPPPWSVGEARGQRRRFARCDLTGVTESTSLAAGCISKRSCRNFTVSSCGSVPFRLSVADRAGACRCCSFSLTSLRLTARRHKVSGVE
jgi:hypothetical protein